MNDILGPDQEGVKSPSGAQQFAEKAAITRRIGRWAYGDHPGLNPGWRLADTTLVLDHDGHGGYDLWVDGRQGDPIDRYLDGAMRYVEEYVEPNIPPATGSPS